MDWSWTAWGVSVAAVILSGALAWREGLWRRRPGLGMGFANHGGMWGDLVLLPLANAAILPHLTAGLWLPLALAVSTGASLWLHRFWYRGGGGAGDHMWPARRRGTWSGDLSRAGWAHVAYVAAELTLLLGFLVHPAPDVVVLTVAGVFTVHVPIGLLQPRWFLTGRIASLREQPLLAPALAALWVVTVVKL